jgi:hypothetical protein
MLLGSQVRSELCAGAYKTRNPDEVNNVKDSVMAICRGGSDDGYHLSPISGIHRDPEDIGKPPPPFADSTVTQGSAMPPMSLHTHTPPRLCLQAACLSFSRRSPLLSNLVEKSKYGEARPQAPQYLG